MPSKAPILASTATTLADQDSLTANVQGNYYHTLHLEWTPGVTGNIFTVKIYTRASSGTGQWTQDMTWANSSGTITRTLSKLQHTAASTTVVPLRYDFTGQAEDLKFVYNEDSTGGAGKGTLVATLTSSPA